MPKFGGKLMDEDIWKIVSYIRREQAKSAGISLDIFIASSKEKSAPYMGGDPQVGEKLFFSEEIVCGKCHTLGGKGGSGIAAGLGPDLTYVARTRAPQFIMDFSTSQADIMPENFAPILTVAQLHDCSLMCWL